MKTVKMIPANNAEQINEELFVDFEGHEIPEAEKHLFHVLMEIVNFNQRGVRQSKPSIQKYTQDIYEFQKKHNGFSGYEVHILHNPTIITQVERNSDGNDISLQDIKGIGASVEKALIEFGIDTIESLSTMEESEAIAFSEKTNRVSEEDVISWVSQAKKMLGQTS